MLLFVDSFSHYATAAEASEKWTNFAMVMDTTGGPRGGGTAYSYNFTHWAAKTFPFGVQELVVGFRYKITSAGTARDFLRITNGGDTQVCLAMNNDNTVSLVRGDRFLGTVLGTSAEAISSNIWTYVELKVKLGDSDGEYEVRLNGGSVLSGTGVDTVATGPSQANGFSIGLVGNTPPFCSLYFCDLYAADTSGDTNNDFLGDARVDLLQPTGDGNYSGFTPSSGSAHWSLVDDDAPDASDYVSASSVGTRDSYTLSDLQHLASQTIFGVQVCAAAFKDDPGTRELATFVRSNGVNGDGAGVTLGTSENYVRQIFETNPDGDVAWTEAAVDSMEAGIKVVV